MAFHATQSQTVLSDALETIVNVVAAGLAWGILHFANRPADSNHPYGHGKAEFLVPAFEGGMITFAGLAITYQSFNALIEGSVATASMAGIWYLVVATLINLILSGYLLYESRRKKSEALRASSIHLASDVFTTLAAFVALGLTKFMGWNWADPVIAISVAVFLIFTGSLLVRKSAAGLLDEQDLNSLRQLIPIFDRQRTPGIIDVHDIRSIRSGNFHHIDAHVVVPEFWDIHKAHAETEAYEKRVVEEYPFAGEIAFHLDPCLQNFCKFCDYPNCEIRKENFIRKTNTLDIINEHRH